MKKIILSSLFAITLVACKKESASTESNSAQVSETTETTSPDNAPALVEISLEKANELFATKENDTLYVTNFFATWCGPCMKEIPHFKDKMAELKDKPVKFTFISLDDKTDWDSVKDFGAEHQLSKNIVLLDGASLNPEFFTKNFKTWQGESIPFTFMKKKNASNETVGSMTKDQLDAKISALLK
ncbi:TlpA family protein disulfide reductase [Amniculibacterium sp. G2-70]|uniref:TlpA family protein disulfide reductase n=1 Tax=Amniculibacterium sp. G2-70 TaxID=2767188 RepID=UPI001654BA6C|nr:TlpA family protein disulfide reductase [Amniculibacterium sp. G2-70]